MAPTPTQTAVDPILLAEGRLDWDPFERQSGRYAGVLVATPEGPSEFAGAPIGAHGRLVAEIVETRRSLHGGDWAQGAAPAALAPKPGERILLGEGPLAVDMEIEGMAPHIGVGRADQWDGCPVLDVDALYRAHSQVVRLWLEPVDLSGLSEIEHLIVEVTGCAAADAAEIEQIMRSGGNPGVLGQLTREQLRRDASGAYDELRELRREHAGTDGK